mgnify:CR=1 FL=1
MLPLTTARGAGDVVYRFSADGLTFGVLDSWSKRLWRFRLVAIDNILRPKCIQPHAMDELPSPDPVRKIPQVANSTYDTVDSAVEGTDHYVLQPQGVNHDHVSVHLYAISIAVRIGKDL